MVTYEKNTEIRQLKTTMKMSNQTLSLKHKFIIKKEIDFKKMKSNFLLTFSKG